MSSPTHCVDVIYLQRGNNSNSRKQNENNYSTYPLSVQ